jgi:choice-of-anchor A domain-containing protein
MAAAGAGTLVGPVTAAYASSTVSCQALPTALGYTEYSGGPVNETHGDSDGPTAFGGAATLGNFAISVTQGLVPASNVAYIQNGAVNGGGTSAVHFGNGYYDSTLSGLAIDNGGTLNAVSQSNLPISFSTATAQAASFSAQLAALPTSPGDLSGISGTTLTLTSTQTETSGDYVWDLTSGELSPLSAIKVVGVPAGGSVIINVPDSGTLSLDIALTLDGAAASSTTTQPSLAATTILNFPNVTTLTLSNGDYAGELLAPAAALTFSNSHLWGGLVAGVSLTGTMESTYGPLSALCVPSPGNPLPDGKPLLLVGSGLLAIGVVTVVRRRSSRNAPAV